MKTTTASIIAELRKEAGYTQKSLAEALHVTDKAISKWERGICQPDSALLPRLSLLLDADIELLIGSSIHREDWVGVLDFADSTVSLREKLYDKPLVYYILSHYLLLGITEIYVKTSEENRKYLAEPIFAQFGFTFRFDFHNLPKTNLMILNRPLFLFGSDLTRQYQGAMCADSVIKLQPVNQEATFWFCPAEYSGMYLKNPKFLYDTASVRTLGRGMVSIEVNDEDSIADISGFIRSYQKNSGLLIGSLEEIAFRSGKMSVSILKDIVKKLPYEKYLLELISSRE